MVDFDIAFTAEYNINHQGMEMPWFLGEGPLIGKPKGGTCEDVSSLRRNGVSDRLGRPVKAGRLNT